MLKYIDNIEFFMNQFYRKPEVTSQLTQVTPEVGTKKALKGLELTMQRTTEGFKKMFKWIGDFFTKGENAKLKQGVFGACVGAFALATALDIKDKMPKKPKSKKTRAELKEEIEKPKKTKEELKEEVERKKVTDLDERIKREEEEAIEIPSDFEKIRKDKSLSKAEKIVKVAHLTEKRGLVRKNCWDFVAKVYKLAGFTRGPAIFNTVKTYGKEKNCGKNCAPDNVLDKLEPGDHIFVNNKNKADDHGNHSVIFLGWKNKSKYEAKTMGYWALKQKFSESNIILKYVPGEELAKMSKKERRKVQPVTKITKPV